MANQFWYSKDGARLGPVGGAAIRELVSSGEISADDSIAKVGANDWTKVGSVPDLQRLLPQTEIASEPPTITSPDRKSVLSRFWDFMNKDRGTIAITDDAARAEAPAKSGAPDRTIGFLIMLAGLGLMLYGMFAEKTVGAGGGERVYNTGLLNEGTNFVICGAAVFLAGVINLGVVRLLQSLPPRNDQ